MIKHFRYLYIVCILCVFKINAQVNLVLNPSFEVLDSCPSFLNEANNAKYWDWVNPLPPSHTIPDCKGELFNICGFFANGCSEPLNNMGYQKPRTGNSYIGLTTMYSMPPVTNNKRDYLKGQLKNTLQAGKNYCLKFYYSGGDNMIYATNRFGAYVDNGTVSTYNCCKDMPVTPQAQNNPAVFMTDTMNWVKIQGSFTAFGNENTITLGNFVDSATIQFQLFNSAKFQAADYYIDDVSLLPIDTTAFAGNDKTICAGDKVFIGRKQEVGLDCIWYDLSGNQLSDSAGWFAQPAQTSSYVVKMDNCNISYDTVTITVIPNVKGKVTITASPQNICPNQTVQLQATATNSVGLQYSWQPPSVVSNSTIPNPIASTSASTSYQLITTPSSLSIYCGADTSKVFVRVISPQPSANAGTDTTVCEGKTAHIGSNNNSCAWCTYTWFPSTGLQNPNAAYTNVSLSYTVSQTYILSKKDSCQTTTDKVNLLVKDCTPDSVNITVPNIFTPNNDGKNDTWNMLIEGRGLIFDLQTTIYNRWGKKIFESTNINQDWNGCNFYDGVPCSADTYFYIISYTDGNSNENKTLKGFLELIR
jgi:gliding motility-associated-like protein